MATKRKEDLVKQVNELIESGRLASEDCEVVKRLLDGYESNTFGEWSERHEFYRNIVDDMVNDCAFEDEKLAEKMAKNHPTLQQSYFRHVCKFIKKMANKDYYDDRNKASVECAKKMVGIIDETYLPCI